MFMLMSKAVTEWVSAPTLIKSTPVAATSFRRGILILPEASVLARPPISLTASGHFRIAHIVQHDDFRSGSQCLTHFVKIRGFHFDLDSGGNIRPYCLNGIGDITWQPLCGCL